MVKVDTHEIISHVLTPEGSQIAADGSHEARVWSALPTKGQGTPVTPVQLKIQVGDVTAKVGPGRALKNGWIGKEADGFVKLVSCRPYVVWSAYLTCTQASTIKDITQIDLLEIQSSGTLKSGEKDLADLRKRKLIVQRCLCWPIASGRHV